MCCCSERPVTSHTVTAYLEHKRYPTPSASTQRCPLRQQAVLNHSLAGRADEALVEAHECESQPPAVLTEKVEDRVLQIADADRVLCDGITQFIGFAVDISTFYSSTC